MGRSLFETVLTSQNSELCSLGGGLRAFEGLCPSVNLQSPDHEGVGGSDRGSGLWPQRVVVARWDLGATMAGG